MAPRDSFATSDCFEMSIAPNPDPIDLDVGARVRIQRKTLGLSQTALAEALNLTFQQVQKYERGANRISASMLVKIAAKLNTTVAALVGENEEGEAPPGLLKKLAEPGAVTLLNHYAGMNVEKRRALIDLTRAMVDTA
jgi:transcriptional regulator with XRE-family HTH domain